MRGDEDLRARRGISTWMVFACRILTDIQEIVGDKVKQGGTLLRETAQTSSKKVNMGIVGAPGSEVENERWAQNRWTSSQNDLLERIYHEGDLSMLDDKHHMLEELKKRFLEKRDKLPRKCYQSYQELREDRSEKAERILVTWSGNITPGASKMKLQMIQPSEKESFIYTCNPIFCGFKMFEIAFDLE